MRLLITTDDSVIHWVFKCSDLFCSYFIFKQNLKSETKQTAAEGSSGSLQRAEELLQDVLHLVLAVISHYDLLTVQSSDHGRQRWTETGDRKSV